MAIYSNDSKRYAKSTDNTKKKIPEILDSNTNVLTTRQDSGLKIVCYYSSWAWLRPGDGAYVPENIPDQTCTHVIYSFAGLDSKNLVLQSNDRWTDTDNSKRLKTYKQHINATKCTTINIC